MQLETRASLGELEAIAAVPGVDALLIGPSDLAVDLGHLSNPGHRVVRAAIADAYARCARLGKPVGTFAPVEADARRYVDLGVTLAAVGNDAVVLRQGADARLKAFAPDRPRAGGSFRDQVWTTPAARVHQVLD